MITLSREQIDKVISIQKRVIRGKEKFIHYLRDMEVSNVRDVRTYMDVRPAKKFADRPDMYITLWTPGINTSEVTKFLSTGVYDNNIMLSFHVWHNSWYYSMSKGFAWNELPLFLQQYMTVHFFEELQTNPIFTFSGKYFGTCHRNYGPLLEHHASIRDLIFSTLGYHILDLEYVEWAENQLHPRGEYDKYFVNPDMLLKFDDIMPSFGDDAYFNAQIQGVDDHKLAYAIANAQYCNLKGTELMSLSITRNFWLNLENRDEL